MMDYPLYGSIWTIPFVIVGYLLLVKKIGPWFMKERQPYDVKGLLEIYNLLQVALNLYIFTKVSIIIARLIVSLLAYCL